MSETNYRALCAELVQLSAPTDSIPQLAERLQKLSELASRTRAALAQPEPQGPSDQELLRLYRVATPCYEVEEYKRELDFARAVLARWGTPAIEPVPVSERLPGPEDCDAEGGCWFWHPGHKEDDFIDGWILLDPKWAGSRRDSDDSLIYTHWLPANALPNPEAVDD